MRSTLCVLYAAGLLVHDVPYVYACAFEIRALFSVSVHSVEMLVPRYVPSFLDAFDPSTRAYIHPSFDDVCLRPHTDHSIHDPNSVRQRPDPCAFLFIHMWTTKTARHPHPPSFPIPFRHLSTTFDNFFTSHPHARAMWITLSIYVECCGLFFCSIALANKIWYAVLCIRCGTYAHIPSVTHRLWITL